MMTWRAPAILIIYNAFMIPAAFFLNGLRLIGFFVACTVTAAVFYLSIKLDRYFRPSTSSEVAEDLVSQTMRKYRLRNQPIARYEAEKIVLTRLRGRVFVSRPIPHFCTLRPGGCDTCEPLKGKHRDA